ncbi:hypothetical protein V5O48_007950 [Marasmius crinis-equi]|uniref:O-methyltransferase C-terminal domain-containing protein n=1 Tax=Marasmius crinis-equi TaxID=585013 RepID=A0ABR3FFE3_9AGAR
MYDPLRSLADIISSAVSDLESQYSQNNLNHPSLDDPYYPNPMDNSVEVANAKRLIVAAAAQLIAAVTTPTDLLKQYSTAMFTTTTLGVAVDTKIADFLGVAGPKASSSAIIIRRWDKLFYSQGLHVDKLAENTGLDSLHLGRILRFLATRHIFREVSPNTFANNRHSSILRTTKPSVQGPRNEKPGDHTSFSSFVSFFADESMKAACHLSDFIQNPQNHVSPFALAFPPYQTTWEWFKQPGNEWRAARFASVMKDMGDSVPAEVLLDAANWQSMEPDTIIVDVGGGVGSAALLLYERWPHLRYVVQDLEIQISAGAKFWEHNAPQGLQSGRVQLQVHDFFTPQPVQGAGVYLLRLVTHNWQDDQVKDILRHLRSAASPSSRVIVMNNLATHTCEVPSSFPKAPYPLLANFGVASAGWDTALDMEMLTYFNTRDRTIHEFTELGRAAGWKLEEVKPGMLATLVFTPIPPEPVPVCHS